MDFAVGLVYLAVSAAVAGGYALVARRRDREQNALAAALGGRYHALFREIRLTRGVWQIVVRYRRGRYGPWTAVELPDLAPAWLFLHVEPRTALPSLAEAIGFRKGEVGHPDFEQHYRVGGNDDDVARALLSRPLRGLIANLPQYTFAFHHGTLGVTREGHERDAATLAAAVDAACAFAARDRELAEEWRRLAALLGAAPVAARPTWQPGPDSALVLEQGARRVHIEIARRRPARSLHWQTSTRVAVARGASDEEFTIAPADAAPIGDRALAALALPALAPDYAVRSRNAALTQARLSPERCVELGALAPRLVEGGATELALELPGVVLDPATLRRGLVLAGALADPVVLPSPVGPYR